MLENLMRTQGARLFDISQSVSMRQEITGKWQICTHKNTEYGLLTETFQLFDDQESAVAEFTKLSAEAPQYSNLRLPEWRL